MSQSVAGVEKVEEPIGRGRTRDAISEYFRMTMQTDGGEGWSQGYLAGFEGAITLVDFLSTISLDEGADVEEVLKQLREELMRLEELK